MKFSYTALGSDNQKLTGIMDAESLESAHEELHKMGLSVISLNETTGDEQIEPSDTESQQADIIVTYYFLGQDPHGKEVNGTIDAQSSFSAYKRLITEYRFQVIDLYKHGSADPETASLKEKFSEWNVKLKEEGIDLAELRKKSDTKNELTDEGEKMAEEIVTEIDNFIVNTKAIINEHQSQYSKPFLQEITATLDKLERIRTSNNLKHITKVCNDLYKLIANPDQITEELTEKPEGKEYKSIVNDLKESGFISSKFNILEAHKLKSKAGKFGKVQGLFSKITSELKTGDSMQVRPLKRKKMKWLSKLGTGLVNENKTVINEDLSYRDVISAFFIYLKETNTILRRAKKQELSHVYKQYVQQKHDKKISAKIKVDTAVQESSAKDFSGFFMEVDSFLGWLLFFYLTYFFLISFSLERNIGLSRELVIKTLSSPLIINISIFLVFAHLAFKLKVRLFRRNFFGTAFLLFFSFGIYAVIIANF